MIFLNKTVTGLQNSFQTNMQVSLSICSAQNVSLTTLEQNIKCFGMIKSN